MFYLRRSAWLGSFLIPLRRALRLRMVVRIDADPAMDTDICRSGVGVARTRIQPGSTRPRLRTRPGVNAAKPTGGAIGEDLKRSLCSRAQVAFRGQQLFSSPLRTPTALLFYGCGSVFIHMNQLHGNPLIERHHHANNKSNFGHLAMLALGTANAIGRW